MAKKRSWPEDDREKHLHQIDKHQLILNIHSTQHVGIFRLLIMAALMKKVPVLLEMAKPKLNVFVEYAKVELIPPTPAKIPTAISDLSIKIANLQKQTFRNWTVQEAAINTAIGLEVFCWFFTGECIGKGSLVGYQV